MPSASNGETQLYFEVHGEGDPIVLIPGLGQAIEAWSATIGTLSMSYQVIPVDPRGVSRSDKPDVPYTGQIFALDIAAVLDAAGVDAAHLVGHSMGGMIAQEFAIRYPLRTKSLVLASTYAATDDWSRRLFEVRRAMIEHLGILEHFKLSTMFVFSPRTFRSMREWLAGLEQARNANPPNKQAYLRQLQFCTEHDTTGRLHQISAPTLIVVGAEDILTSPAQSRDLANGIPGAEYREFPELSHGIVWEDPPLFNGLVMEFVARSS